MKGRRGEIHRFRQMRALAKYNGYCLPAWLSTLLHPDFAGAARRSPLTPIRKPIVLSPLSRRAPGAVLFALAVILARAGSAAARPVHTETLPNGMKLILREDHAHPLVALDLWIETGSADDPPDASGVAHLLEHMLFKGTTKRGVGGVDEEMENLGASLEASTSRDWSHLYATVASRFYPQALNLLADVALHATVPESELQREKGVVIDELVTARADPLRGLTEALTALAYGDHPYGRAIPGDPSKIMAVSRDAVAHAQKRVLVGSNLALVIVGDFDPGQAADAARKALAGAPTGVVHRATLEPVHWRKPGEVEIAINGDSAYLLLGFPGPSVTQKKDVAAADLIYAALDGEGNGRLTRALIETGLASRVEVDFLTQRGPGLVTIAAQCSPDRVDRVREAIETEIAALRDAPLPAAEIAAAQRRLLSQHAFDTETYAGDASNLGFYEALGQPEFATSYPDTVTAITPEELRDAARRYLDLSAAVRLTARPKPPEEPPSRPSRPKIVPLPSDDSAALGRVIGSLGDWVVGLEG